MVNSIRITEVKLSILGLAILLMSCQEEAEVDPALQKKYDEQEILIESSRIELESLERQIAQFQISDPTPDLNEVKSALAAAVAKQKELEQKLKTLESEAVASKKKLEEYQAKYPLRSQ